jgi:hypothetical protein
VIRGDFRFSSHLFLPSPTKGSEPREATVKGSGDLRSQEEEKELGTTLTDIQGGIKPSPHSLTPGNACSLCCLAHPRPDNTVITFVD